jgi:hypothetical protein
MTSNASCVSGSPATSNAITMTVNNNVTASVSISATVTTICSGTSVTFTATPTNGGTTPTYLWYKNGISTASAGSTYTSSTLVNNDVISCVMTSNASCVSGSPATSNAITMTVNNNVTASVSISATATSICSGNNVTFTAIPINGGTTPTYQWKKNGISVGSNSPVYATTSLVNNDIVSCVLTSNALCVSSSPATSNQVVISVNSQPVADDPAFNVEEFTPNGSLVGIVTATDPDSGQSLTYTIAGGNINNAFSINSSSGLITVANSLALNYLVTPVFNLEVEVTDNAPCSLTDISNVTIHVTQINNAPVANPQQFSLVENSSTGTIVGTVVATDPDPGQVLTYAIVSGNTSGAFSISSATGVLSVANSLAINYELTSVYNLQISVTDNAATPLTSIADVTVNILDINEAPVCFNDAFSIYENTPNNSIVGAVSASDPDNGQSLEFAIVGGNTNGAFTVDPVSGVISVSNALALDYEVNPIFTIVVNVTDNGTPSLSCQSTIIIDLFDVNEAPVVNNQTFFIAENSSNGTPVGTVIATDPDAGQILHYMIVAGNLNNAFTLNPLTGQITVANSSALIYSLTPVFYLTVSVTDNGEGNLSAEAIMTIHIEQAGNNPPVIEDQSFTTDENSLSGTFVGNVIATDPDNGQSLTYQIISGNIDNAFSINAVSGVITVNNSAALDYEVNFFFVLTVSVTDNASNSLSSQAYVTIYLNDVNENPVVEDQVFYVEQFASPGTQVGQVIASDPDIGQSLTYSFVSGNNDEAFYIDPATGLITVNNSWALDPSMNLVFSLDVMVTDDGTGNLTDNAIVTIFLLPPPNQPPIVNNQFFWLPENSENGTYVGTVVAYDPNLGQTLTYSILGGNLSEAFSIDQFTGDIFVANSILLDFEINPSFEFVVQVQDNGTGLLSSQAVVIVNLIDINEYPAVNDQSFGVTEAVVSGDFVGKVLAFDPDSAQVLTYSLLGGNTDNAFALDAMTGVLTIANPDAIDFETNPQFILLVSVTDNGAGLLMDQAFVQVNVQDSNEPPVILDKYFTINENSPNGSFVGKVRALDPDSGQILRYFIVDGNTGNAFSINQFTGVLTVANSTMLDYETYPSFDLVVRVVDNGAVPMSSQAIVTVDLLNINESPVIVDHAYTILPDAPTGYVIGCLNAMDPDSGQVLTYQILSGNEEQIFNLDNNGILSIMSSARLHNSIHDQFNIQVLVKDNGPDNLYANAMVRVYLASTGGSTVIYIDPENLNDIEENGTLQHPYDSWFDFPIRDGYTCMQRRGTEFVATGSILIENVSDINIGAYGSGSLPRIKSMMTGSSIFDISNADRIVIKNYDLRSEVPSSIGIFHRLCASNSLIIDSCIVQDFNKAVVSNSAGSTISVSNTDFKGITGTAFDCNGFSQFNMSGCALSDFVIDTTQHNSESTIALQLAGEDASIYLGNNVIESDNTNPGNLIILTGTNCSILAEGNTFLSPEGSQLTLLNMNNTGGNSIVRYNRFKGGKSGIYSLADHVAVYYNQFVKEETGITILENSIMTVMNNTFASNINACVKAMLSSVVELKNNIYYLDEVSASAYDIAGTFASDYNLFNTEKNSFLNGINSLAIWRNNTGQDIHSQVADPLFTNLYDADFTLQPGSPAINRGVDVELIRDYFGIEVPLFGIPDIGCSESVEQAMDSDAQSDLENKVQVDVYPNPTTGLLKLKFENSDDEDVYITVLDVNGNYLVTQQGSARKIIELDVHHLPSGSYYLLINVGNQLLSRKVIKN